MCLSVPDEVDRYALVSSYYGPGAVGGWYLTALASLISFGLNPRKRSLDSITADLITALTYPTVATAHVISQVWSYPRNMQSLDESSLVQYAASVEAGLIVNQIFLTIDIILFLLAVGFKCVNRGCLLAIIGLFCLSVECYLRLSPFMMEDIQSNFDRPILVNSRGFLLGETITLLVGIVLAFSLIILPFLMRLTPYRPQTVDQNAEATPEQDAEAMRTMLERDFKQSNTSRAITWASMLFVPINFAASFWPLWSGHFRGLPSQPLPWLRAVASRFAHGPVPRSNVSIKELDQTVAVLTGATVLGFSLYSLAETYYQHWFSRTCTRPQQQKTELTMHSQAQTPSHWMERFREAQR